MKKGKVEQYVLAKILELIVGLVYLHDSVFVLLVFCVDLLHSAEEGGT